MKSRISWELIVIGIVIVAFWAYTSNGSQDADPTGTSMDWDSDSKEPVVQTHIEDRPEVPQNTLSSKREDVPVVEANNRERMVALGQILTSVGTAVDEMGRSGDFNDRFNESSATMVTEERFSAFALASVNVDIETGHLQLISHTGSEVIVQVWVSDRNKSGEFERFYRTTISKNPESVQVRIQRKDRNEHWTSRLQRLWATDVSNSITAGVRVLVPEGGLTYKFHTHAGNIEARNVGGDINLETRAGNLTLYALYGRSVAETRAGNIRADQISGTTALRTGAGNIMADNIRANTELRTRAGNITATVLSTNQRIDAESRVGNVQIYVPADIRADISVDGSNAQLDELFNFDGEKEAQYIRGTVNGGGPLIRVHSRVGNSGILSNTNQTP
jgi:hypothetical protein